MFLFVDRILEMEPGLRATGISNISAIDALLSGGDPASGNSGVPTVPPCLLGEAVGQLAAWTVMDANGFERRPVGALIEKVEILGPVPAGDPVRLDIQIDELDDESVVYHGSATTSGREVLKLEKAFSPLLPTETFDDPESLRERFGQIKRGLASSVFTGARPIDYGCDILKHDPGQEIIGEKRFSGSEPLFSDHFPRKPVVPLTMLMECLLRLARRLFEEGTYDAEGVGELGGTHGGQLPTLITVRNAKINRFILPLDMITARVWFVERRDGLVRILARCDVDGRRACQAKIDFSTDVS